MTQTLSVAEMQLDEVLDLKAARPLHQALLAHRGEDLKINAAQVRRLGALCLQVLLSAVATWIADGKSLAFVDPSDAFVESLNRLGVLPSAAP